MEQFWEGYASCGVIEIKSSEKHQFYRDEKKIQFSLICINLFSYFEIYVYTIIHQSKLILYMVQKF